MSRALALDATSRPWQTATLEAGAGEARDERRGTDARLAGRANRGDEDAFREIVERYQRKVFWVAYDVLLDAEEARDVAQETFLRVHAALATYDPSRDFLNWIYRIARNLAIDAFRRRRRRPAPVADLAGPAAPDGESAPVRAEVREQVAAVLAEMPLEYRLALTLREYHGLSPREIAAITDCTYPTARWRLHRARGLFRDLWEKRWGRPSEDLT